MYLKDAKDKTAWNGPNF